MPDGRSRVPLSAVLVLAAMLSASCARAAPPEEVAREYGRSLYANDADALWRLISTADRRVKDQATFRRQQRDLRAFAREAVWQLAGYITSTPVRTVINGDRATVTLRFRLPDANAPEIRTLMHDWDEERLAKLPDAERKRIRAHLDEMLRQGALPTIEGDEIMELVRESGVWKIFLNWAGGVRVRFATAVDAGGPLDVTVTPAEVVLAPGDRVRVTLRVSNVASREVPTRVGHRIEPETQSRHLALLVCPLFVPVTLDPGESREFTSEYLLLADAPADLRSLQVTYLFPTRPPHASPRHIDESMARHLL